MDLDTDTNDELSPIKRYRSDPSLFMPPHTPSNSRNDSPMSDNSENIPSSSKAVRRQLVARRFSTSNVSPRTIMRIPSRLDQIKFEESIDKFLIEAAHEKEVQSALNVSRSWEHLSLSDAEPMAVDGQKAVHNYDQLLRQPNVFPSPSRQCISPLATYSNSSSPSNSISCASPVIMGQGPLNVAKRKLNASESIYSPAKRLLLSPSAFLPDISPRIIKIVNSTEDAMSSNEGTPTSRLISQSSSSSSLLVCQSDDSSISSPPLSIAQPIYLPLSHRMDVILDNDHSMTNISSVSKSSEPTS